MRQSLAVAPILALIQALIALTFSAHSQTIDFDSGFLTSGTALALNHSSGIGNPSLDGSKLELTNGSADEARSAYYLTKVNIRRFQTQFEFQILNPTANGFTFCIQRGALTATGGDGADLGYVPIPASIAIKFNIYPDVSTTGLYINGAPSTEPGLADIDVKAISGIDFHSGHIMSVTLTYSDGILNEHIVDLTTKTVFTQEYSINIPSTIGASSAYAGFTAATAVSPDTSTDDLLTWTFTSIPASLNDVLMYRADLGSTGQYPNQTVLDATNVNSTDFGKLFSYFVDGNVYAQPLFKASVPITTGVYKGTTHDVVFVATEHDSVYAFDANNAAGAAPLWKTSFINAGAGITTVPAADLDSNSISPEVGITGTPVIDPTTNLLLVCAKTKKIIAGKNHYYFNLHAIDISSGAEHPGSPVLIADTVAVINSKGVASSYSFVSGPSGLGGGSGSVGGHVAFNALRQHQRPALALVNGVVYIASGCEGDVLPYHGWILGYNVNNFRLTAVWNDTPDGAAGGIWNSGGGLAADPLGNLYALTGNGTFKMPAHDAATASYNEGDYGDSFVKLAPDPLHATPANPNSNGWGLKVVDYFTPNTQAYMAEHDLDLGSGDILLLPNTVGSPVHPHLMVGAGKLGTIYLVDCDKMGGYDATKDNIVQEKANAIGQSFDTPGYYNGAFYYFPSPAINTITHLQGKSFAITTGSFAASKLTADTYPPTGASPIISGSSSIDPNAVLWSLYPGQLRAYKASNIGIEIYNTAQAAGGRDLPGGTCPFAVPIVAGSSVYVPTANGLVVYGLLNGGG